MKVTVNLPIQKIRLVLHFKRNSCIMDLDVCYTPMQKGGIAMKLIVIGDSITVGTYTGENECSPKSVAHPNFAELLQNMLGCEELVNYAHNGISVSSTSPVFPDRAIVTRYRIMEDADILLVCGGTNDFGTGVALGAPTDTEDVSFFGALDILYRGLKERYPHAEIYIVKPIHRHDERENKIGLSLDRYRDAIELRARQYGFPTIDGYAIPVDPTSDEHRRLYAKDGVHLNPAGHRL